jgi:subfamily B ATP-binding cassette protein HlyB/CyaB
MNRIPLSREQRELPVSARAGRSSFQDSGLQSLVRIAMRLGVHFDPAAMAHELALGGRKARGDDLVRAAAKLGFKACVLSNQPIERLESVQRPALLRMKDGSYIVLGERRGELSETFEGDATQATLRTTEQLAGAWTGEVVMVGRQLDSGLPGASQPEFGLRWFLPSLWRYRKPLAQILLASLFVQILTIVSPVFTQVVVDKVLVHNSMSTLLMVVIAMVVLAVFDVTLQYLRGYAVSHTASRLDLELGSRVFNHLIRQPMSYFESNPTGQTLARMGEVTTIRVFFMGQGMVSLLDVPFATTMLIIMFMYSVAMTCVALGFMLLYLLVQLALRPLGRELMKERFQRGAESQQFMVETVTGAQTIKAAAVEPLMQLRYDELLARFIKTSFNAVIVNTFTQSVIQFLSKLSVAATLYVGARAVMDKDISIGEMIAFNMMATQVSAPILRLASLWQDFQQFHISLGRLGDIMKSPTEQSANTQIDLPPMRGAIGFHKVGFRYRPDTPEVIQDLSLEIESGQVIGIVGLSGSGKSTLAKLLQRFYLPQRGQITIDGIDIATLHPAWIRQQMGVVLQETVLFNRTVHENIALAEPYTTREQVVALARLAGADEFISQLAQGYDTLLSERGANLSGGQRQRIAIARSLLRNPRILILDEATSAVDYESERIIQKNLRQIARGRTVVIIAHRLCTVRDCDRIIGMAEGRIVEEGTHEVLLTRENGLYRRLWALQDGLAAD